MPIAPDMQTKGFQPEWSNVSKGWLKASRREQDPARGTQYVPYAVHTKRSPLGPGKIYKFDVPLQSTAYVFKKRHRNRLEIVNSDSPVTELPSEPDRRRHCLSRPYLPVAHSITCHGEINFVAAPQPRGRYLGYPGRGNRIAS